LFFDSFLSDIVDIEPFMIAPTSCLTLKEERKKGIKKKREREDSG
jgi:hypothetical protein